MSPPFVSGAIATALIALCAAPVVAERSFTLFIENGAIDEQDAGFFGPKTWLKIRTVNKTMNVIEWDYDLLKDLPENAQSKWNMQEKMDGQYRPSSIKGTATVCDDLHSKRPSIRALGYSRSSLPKNCPIGKGLYTLRNHVPNENYFPVIIPGNQWRLLNTWFVDGKPIIKFHMDIKVDRTKKMQG